MKILQINNCHYRRGGADIVYLNTGELLTKNGHEVFYFSTYHVDNELIGNSDFFIQKKDFFKSSIFKKLSLIPRFFYSITSKQNIENLIINLNPDIAHIHLYKADLTPSILSSLKKYKIPVIISLHDLGFLCPHNLMLDGNMNLCSRCVNHTPLNCIIHKCNRNNLVLSTISSFEYIYQTIYFPFNQYFDRIITLSKFSQKLHIDSNYFGIPIDHMYNFFPNLSETKPNSNKGHYFLFLGRLSGEKGITTLVDAWLKKDRKSRLIIAGSGELMNNIQNRLDTNSNIELIGYKSGKELSDLIFNASFIIIPSECYENNPLSVIEAYSYGKPVIGSNIGGIPEIIDNGNTGYLFKMKSVKELSEKIDVAENVDEQEYARLSVNARKFADLNFNPETHYTNLMNLYSQTISSYTK